MVCRTEAGQSPGTNRAGLLLDRSKREALYTRRNSLRNDFGRIRWVDTGYTSTACLKSFAEVMDTSTFEQVGHVAKK